MVAHPATRSLVDFFSFDAFLAELSPNYRHLKLCNRDTGTGSDECI